ncbi:unnamed protein product [Heterobilharzia americana]|nr:unnamed protein product [Heterobilharzia americana]
MQEQSSSKLKAKYHKKPTLHKQNSRVQGYAKAKMWNVPKTDYKESRSDDRFKRAHNPGYPTHTENKQNSMRPCQHMNSRQTLLRTSFTENAHSKPMFGNTNYPVGSFPCTHPGPYINERMVHYPLNHPSQVCHSPYTSNTNVCGWNTYDQPYMSSLHDCNFTGHRQYDGSRNSRVGPLNYSRLQERHFSDNIVAPGLLNFPPNIRLLNDRFSGPIQLMYPTYNDRPKTSGQCLSLAL